MTDRHRTAASRRGVLKLAAAGVAAGFVGSKLGPREAAAASVEHDGPPPGGVFPVQVGGITAYVIADSVLRFPLVPTFCANADPAAAKAQLASRFLPADEPGPVPVNALLIDAPGATVLIDAGAGPAAQAGSSGFLAGRLAALGVEPGDLDAVVVTHLHFDHFGGLVDPESAAAFGKARVLMTEDERGFWSSNPGLDASAAPAEMRGGIVERAGAALAGLGSRVEAVPGDHALAAGVKLVSIPGHTPGHVGVELESGGERLVFFTDLLHVAGMQFARPEWYAFFDVRPDAAIASRRRWLDRFAAEGELVAGTHMPWPGVGRVRRDGPAYAWEPVVWSY